MTSDGNASHLAAGGAPDVSGRPSGSHFGSNQEQPLKSAADDASNRSDHHVPAICLGVSLFLFGVSMIASPGPGLDPSWRTGINMASDTGMHFGRDIIFTYGPLGFLDTAQSLSRIQIALSMVFSLTATALLWTALYVVIKRATHQIAAAVISSVMVGIISGVAVLGPSLLILMSAAVLSLYFMKSDGAGYLRWTPPAISAMAAILLQVKFSEGVALIAVAGLCSIFSPSQALRRVVESAVAFAATFAVTWLFAGQRLSDVPAWLAGSFDIALGYSEAMSEELEPNLLSYFVGAVLAVTVVTLAIRWTATQTRLTRLGTLLVVLCLLGFAFKQGFTRNDGHDRMFFAMTAILLAVFFACARRRQAVIGLFVVSLVFTSSTWARFNPTTARDVWKTDLQLLVDDDYQLLRLENATLDAQSFYELPDAFVSAAGRHPVSVDPRETTLAWAYGFNWHPVPIFQTYAAYTPALDQLNADAIVRAPADQVVIRGRPAPVDGRNIMWETPRYLLALACNYDVGPLNRRWMVLKKGEQRCSAPAEESTTGVEAGRRVTLPDARADQMLVGHFTPDKPSLTSLIFRALGKNYSPLLVTADGVEYRVPRGLASGPMLLQVPPTLKWPKAFHGGLHYEELVFSEPGRLKLETVTVESR